MLERVSFINVELINSSLIFCIFVVNKYGYFRSDYKQAEEVVHRYMKIYDSLGIVLNCESK